jgi:CubicO group peptidase (beta-lactamase class C family)/D-alanyl-D-alanine dipeptidase
MRPSTSTLHPTLRALAAGLLPGLLLAALALTGCGPADGARVGPRDGYGPVAERLTAFVEHEMEDKGIPGLAVALVDDQRVVWARGFGLADSASGEPATARTVWRVGSVSKLFTDLAVMQRVEAGELDLDAPVTEYLPDVRPENPYERPITLRHLMSHRSGLVREPPAGHYFDSTGTSLEETVRSLNGTELVHAPGTATKYSNAGLAVVGYVLQETEGRPFAELLAETLLADLGMDRSAFTPEPALREELAEARMWTYDGRRFPAPTFQLGMAPAGSMYSTVRDLGGFLSALFAGGRGPGGQVVEPETLERMWTPEGGGERGYGLGFGVDTLAGERAVGHGGAIYGFSTQLTALPGSGLGAVVVANLDGTNTVTSRIARSALRMMKAHREGAELPEPMTTDPVPAERARAVEGRYGESERAVDLEARGGELTLSADRGGHRVRVRRAGDGLLTDGRLGFGSRIRPLEDGIVLDGDTLRRRPDRRPAPAPAAWEGLIGEYGPDYNTLYVLEHRGGLHALVEWFYRYPLERVEGDVWRFPDRGLYSGERVVFHRDDTGRATAVTMAGIRFERRQAGPAGGGTFRIDPVKPIDELRRDALAASPPEEEGDFREPDLVELGTLDAPIRFDVRYATTNNFMGSVFYQLPRAYLQRPAAEAVGRAARRLAEEGYGLLVYDAYRPWFVTKMFWDATPEDMKQFVADPSDGSRHNRGAAVDLTLYHLDSGEPAATVSGYDEFTARAFPRYPGGTSLERWHRELLREAMEAEGFSVYRWEWWHFDHGDWREYPILNRVFEELGEAAPDAAAVSPATVWAGNRR